jgi:hypothetical protein
MGMVVSSPVSEISTLPLLGVSDPVLPTWGKLIVEGLSSGIHTGDYHLVLEPLSLPLLVGSALVLLGVALERTFQPRLREVTRNREDAGCLRMAASCENTNSVLQSPMPMEEQQVLYLVVDHLPVEGAPSIVEQIISLQVDRGLRVQCCSASVGVD